jgi:hypothetical protein
MSTDPRRAKDVFLAALDRSSGDRLLFLDKACAGDAELRTAVDQLLAAHAHPASAVCRPLVSAAFEAPGSTGTFSSGSANPEKRDDETFPHSRSKEHVGTVLAGKYKLVEEIGEGAWVACIWPSRPSP